METKGVLIESLSQEQVTSLITTAVNNAVENTVEKINNDQLLTQSEAAVFLRTSKQTLINWAARGIVVPHELGGRVYYRKSELLKSGISIK